MTNLLTIKQFSKVLMAFVLATVSVVSQAKKETITFIHTDHLGSPIMATNEDGSVKWREDYQPFGKQLTNQDTDNNVGFTGHLDDKNLGLSYMQARWYSPTVGRFMSPDPVRFVDSNTMSYNRYLYVNNNPYKYTDPNGEFLNFAVKFVVDVAVESAIQYATTGKVDLGSAMSDAAMGMLNPAKTLNRVKTLSKLMKKKSGGESCCFVAGTQVLTEDGYKNIEDVKLGEKLKAKNTETGEVAWKPVTKLWVEHERGIYDIRLTTVDGFEQKIQATDDHPFYVIEHGWKTTIELRSGDKIESNLDTPLTVKSVTDEKRTDVTYNFTVADFHTYYVTERNVLVHNCNLGTKAVLTNKQAQKKADSLGLKNVTGNVPKAVQKQVKNNPVYYDKKNKSFYSPDKAGHRADNAWKKFDSAGKRSTGTFNKKGKFEKVSN